MKKMLGLLLLGGALSMVGCTEPIVANQNPYMPSQVTVTDYWLQNDIYVKVLQPERVGAGQLRAPIEIYNKTDHDLTIDYTYTFVDQGGVQVGNPPTWEFERLPPRGSKQIAPTSMSANAADFRVQIRKAK